jgi:hypothetical protein
MTHTRPGRVAAAFGVLLVLVALPLTTFAAQSHKPKSACITTKHPRAHTLAVSATGPVIQFGQFGGNIRPWDAAINADGTVTAKGITAAETRLADPKNALNGLLKLADAEGFWSVASATACSGTLPDIASRYIQITSNTGTRKIAVHGACVDGFNQLFAELMAVGNAHY